MWVVLFDGAFAVEFTALPSDVRKAITAYAVLLEAAGPHLGHPHADTLKDSIHRNMKELRPTVNKMEWRVAYAFDPARNAVLLAAVAKGGSKMAYDRLIRTADARFTAHLKRLKSRKTKR